jgi:hypothetical protein
MSAIAVPATAVATLHPRRLAAGDFATTSTAAGRIVLPVLIGGTLLARAGVMSASAAAADCRSAIAWSPRAMISLRFRAPSATRSDKNAATPA